MGIEHTSVVEHPIESVFAWHERPGAFERLTPPWAPLRLVEEAGSLATGRAVVALPGGIRWVSQHSGYEPPRRFVDDLVSLPLRWHHVHSFASDSPGRTRVTDTVETPVPAALLRPVFVYRHTQLRDDLGVQADLRRLGPASLTVAVTGSSGLIGSALCAFLSTGGHRVVRLVRRRAQSADEREWDTDAPDPQIFHDVDAVVHLAGASIAGRFSARHKRAIAASRIAPTRRLAEAVGRAKHPKVLLTASAIGYYGYDRGDELVDEAAGPGDGFLADVVKQWERATDPASDADVRVVRVRTGVVLSARGGMLGMLRPVFLSGFGGRIGDGSQWLSWIDLDDLTDIYAQALVDERFEGALNAVSPSPVRNRELTATLASVLRRPAVVAVPVSVLKAVAGTEGAHEVVCASQRVEPSRLASVGFRYRRPTLEASLRHQLGHFGDDEGRA